MYRKWGKPCVIENCLESATSALRHCSQHYTDIMAQRAADVDCNNPTCRKKRYVKLKFCSLRCYIARAAHPECCDWKNCQTAVPPEIGGGCTEHRPFMFEQLTALYKQFEGLAGNFRLKGARTNGANDDSLR